MAIPLEISDQLTGWINRLDYPMGVALGMFAPATIVVHIYGFLLGTVVRAGVELFAFTRISSAKTSVTSTQAC